MAFTAGRAAEPPASRNKKTVEKLAIHLWLEVDLGGEKVHVVGKGMAAGPPAHWKDYSSLLVPELMVFFI